jgi:hypothetical protein
MKRDIEINRRNLWKWAAAYGGLWIILTALHDTPATSDMAAVIAWTIAGGTVLFLLPQVRETTGV